MSATFAIKVKTKKIQHHHQQACIVAIKKADDKKDVKDKDFFCSLVN